ncbi:hypothetical protein FACS189454_01150 [Planctomycetales bacterium]|nr:hypothetical protein FACS189454_01150 [Planctomycetales bacterium]
MLPVCIGVFHWQENLDYDYLNLTAEKLGVREIFDDLKIIVEVFLREVNKPFGDVLTILILRHRTPYCLQKSSPMLFHQTPPI